MDACLTNAKSCIKIHRNGLKERKKKAAKKADDRAGDEEKRKSKNHWSNREYQKECVTEIKKKK